MSKTAFIVATASGILLLAVSCTKPRSPAPAGPSTAPHWLYSARLQELMMDLQVTTEQNWPASTAETDASLSDDARMAVFDEACALAAALESAAQRMPEAARKATLSEAELRSFTAQAAQLQEQSRQLEQAGVDRNVTQMRVVLNRVTATCDSCHRQFRDLAGPLE